VVHFALCILLLTLHKTKKKKKKRPHNQSVRAGSEEVTGKGGEQVLGRTEYGGRHRYGRNLRGLHTWRQSPWEERPAKKNNVGVWLARLKGGGGGGQNRVKISSLAFGGSYKPCTIPRGDRRTIVRQSTLGGNGYDRVLKIKCWEGVGSSKARQKHCVNKIGGRAKMESGRNRCISCERDTQGSDTRAKGITRWQSVLLG